MAETLKGVIFHCGVLFEDDPATVAQLRSLFKNLKTFGLKTVVFSTYELDIYGALQGRGLPRPDLVLTKAAVGVSKGSHKWVEQAARRLGVKTYQLAYVGDDKRDWRTATNAAIFYVHAEWSTPSPPKWPTPSPPEIVAFSARKPLDVSRFVTHFLLPPPRWKYTLNLDAHGVYLRSLADASVALRASSETSWFRLRDVLTNGELVQVGLNKAQNLLMLHALSSLSLEGLLPRNSALAVYPSSNLGSISPVLQSFLQPASRLFHGYFKEDLLVRAAEAPDTSRERAAGRGDSITFTTQANTVCLNPSYENLIQQNTVLVFDDFTTSGRSLEWARNLLHAAGARKVILLTVGKFGYQHTVFRPRYTTISPFRRKDYEEGQFWRRSYPMHRHEPAQQLLRSSFAHWVDGEALPIT